MGISGGLNLDRFRFRPKKGRPQVTKWAEEVTTLEKVAMQFPQSVYTFFVHCLQAEWQRLSRCVPAVGPLLVPAKTAVHNKLIPALGKKLPCQKIAAAQPQSLSS